MERGFRVEVLGSWFTYRLYHTDQPVPSSKPNLQETPDQEKDQQQSIVRERNKGKRTLKRNWHF